MELPDVTLDWLRDWWAGHPDREAIVAHATHCIIAEPVADATGLPVSYVPGHTIRVWPDGTREGEMVPLKEGELVAEIVPSKEVCELAMAFDSQRKDRDTRRTAREVVELIDKVIKGGN